MVEEFNKILKIVGNPPSQRMVFEKRMKRISEALNWKSGTFEDKIYTSFWEEGSLKIALGKPGKESQDSYSGDINQHDMRPDIFDNGINRKKAATFGDVVYELEKVSEKNNYCVELLGALMFRSAFLLDHVEIKEGVVRYMPSEEVIKYINERVPTIYGISPLGFLHYIDAIALNEDVKYYCKGRNLEKESVGAKNNYLTYVKLIAVITGEIPVSSIANQLLRSGVATIGINEGLRVLPHVGSR